MCLQAHFGGEVAAAMEELHGTYEALRGAQDEAAAASQEVARLQAQCHEFVRRNLDAMLVHRDLAARTTSLEGKAS